MTAFRNITLQAYELLRYSLIRYFEEGDKVSLLPYLDDPDRLVTIGLGFNVKGFRIQLLLIAAASLSLGNGVATAQAPRPDPWTGGNGSKRAAAVVARCVGAANASLSDPKACVLSAFNTCQDEHGTSQRQMNDCGTFSRQAWEARLAVARARLMAARPAGSRPKSPNQLIVRFAQSQRRWDVWNLPDCETQAALSQGGTYHRYDLDICLSNHAAYRTIELETLIEIWAKLFKL